MVGQLATDSMQIVMIKGCYILLLHFNHLKFEKFEKYEIYTCMQSNTM